MHPLRPVVVDTNILFSSLLRSRTRFAEVLLSCTSSPLSKTTLRPRSAPEAGCATTRVVAEPPHHDPVDPVLRPRNGCYLFATPRLARPTAFERANHTPATVYPFATIRHTPCHIPDPSAARPTTPATHDARFTSPDASIHPEEQEHAAAGHNPYGLGRERFGRFRSIASPEPDPVRFRCLQLVALLSTKAPRSRGRSAKPGVSTSGDGPATEKEIVRRHAAGRQHSMSKETLP
jgi:hypothetical protein